MQSGDDDRNDGGGNEKADGRSDEKIGASSRRSGGGKASVQEQRFGEWFCLLRTASEHFLGKVD